MIDEIQISPSDIANEIKAQLKGIIHELSNGKKPSLERKIKYLYNQLKRAKDETTPNKRFSAILGKTINKQLSEDKKKVSTLRTLKKNCEVILGELLGEYTQTDNIDYAIYYTSKNGGLIRVNMTKLPLQLLRFSESTQALKLGSGIANFFEKQQTKLNNQINVTEHYQYMKQVLEQSSKKKQSLFGSGKGQLNEGYLAEAFERHLQNTHAAMLQNSLTIEDNFSDNISAKEAWEYIRESLGTKPWWSGGDVFNTQVKNVSSGEVGLASISSIEGMINVLYSLTNIPEEKINKKVEQLYKLLFPNEADGLKRIGELATQDIYEEIEKNFKIDQKV